MSRNPTGPEPGRPSASPVVLVTRVGAATGAKAAAASLACAAAEPDRAALLIDLASARAPRPTLLATRGARALEERVAVHLPSAAVASRGAICQLTLPADADGLASVAAALPLARESATAVHLPPRLVQETLAQPRIPLTGALLRADLASDRALTALAVRELMERDIRVVVLKRPLGWVAARAAWLGAPPLAATGLPSRLVEQLLAPCSTSSQMRYSEADDEEAHPERTAQQQRRDHAGSRRRRGLPGDPQRGAGW